MQVPVPITASNKRCSSAAGGLGSAWPYLPKSHCTLLHKGLQGFTASPGVCRGHRILKAGKDLRSWSPTTNLNPACSALNHVPKCHIHTFLDASRGGDSTTFLGSLTNLSVNKKGQCTTEHQAATDTVSMCCRCGCIAASFLPVPTEALWPQLWGAALRDLKSCCLLMTVTPWNSFLKSRYDLLVTEGGQHNAF